MIVFRQLFDQQSSTYTYLLADPATREAVLIDPVFEQVQREVALIRELGLTLLCTLETHVHADHVTGAWLLREALGSRIVLAAAGGASGADRELRHGDVVRFGGRSLEARATPGHTNGCMSYVLDDHAMVFTGDALLIRGCGRTDFQEGSARLLYRSIHEQIFTLPDECTVYPGHDYGGSTASSVGEERRFNPRLGGGIREEDFAGYMDNLGLAHPKLMDKAVPANKHCGKPAVDMPAPGGQDWAPLRLTYAGLREIDPQWVEEHRGEVLVLDVREPGEFDSVLGHIAGALLLPLGELGGKLDTLPRDRPVVAVCRSGARSARATQMLEQAGLRAANLAGGMLRWRAQGLAVEAGGE
ncbi:MAG TPA: MBL fold metallo-hydrolase [Pseudomonadales bacterium]|jgi:sulfur dioxygenase|nr:MBL fold metallo-hydrolase [Pseudomonadales bacterium]